jgi:membrane-associated protein
LIHEISNEVLALTGSLNVWLAIAIFGLLFTSEFGISIPYLMETIWILVGFHARSASLPLFDIPILMAVAVLGRSCGATVLYRLTGLGRNRITRIYQRLFAALLDSRSKDKSFTGKILSKVNLFSPFSIAFGRLMWLKIPLTLTMSLKQNLKVLLAGIALSSIIWDLVYILIGMVAGSAQLKSYQTVLFSLAALSIIYVVIYVVRRLIYHGQYDLVNGKDQ